MQAEGAGALALDDQQRLPEALFRATPDDDWQFCHIIGLHPAGVILREVGRLFNGVWIAQPSQIRAVP